MSKWSSFCKAAFSRNRIGRALKHMVLRGSVHSEILEHVTAILQQTSLEYFVLFSTKAVLKKTSPSKDFPL